MSEVGEWGDNREGEEMKAGRSNLVGPIHESLLRERKGGGGTEMSSKLSCKVREYVNIHTETAIMVMLASYESSQHCAGVVTTCLWLITVEVGIHLGGREFKL